MSKPFPWYGGKEALASYLVTLLPPHEVYVEVFGGSGALLFAKKPSRLEVYNDIDSGLVNFFRVLRSREQVQELQRLLDLTPYSREEYYDCLATWKEIDNPIEQARRWYTVVLQSFSNNMDASGWSYTKIAGSNPASAFHSRIAQLSTFIDRMALIQVEHHSFSEVISAYDSPTTCFYLDPPYLPETRRRKGYLHEMTREDHEQLLAILQQIQGMAILSGYTSPLYRDSLLGWQCIERPVTCSSVRRTRESNLQGAGVILASQMRTECIWRNPTAVAGSVNLWSEVPA